MRRLCLVVCGIALAVTSSGCVGLSLFGSDHTHTHYHGNCEEHPCSARLQALEERLARIEQEGGVAHASATFSE